MTDFVWHKTWFSNGSWVITSNAEMEGKLSSPPQINASHLPAASPCEMVLEAHQCRVAAFLEANSGVQTVVLQGTRDVRRAQDELQRIQS